MVLKRLLLILFTLSLGAFLLWIHLTRSSNRGLSKTIKKTDNAVTMKSLPIFISALRERSYPATKITIEETLTPGTNYNRYIASYLSDGLIIHGLYTIPKEAHPLSGFPAIAFIHGHLDPASYTPTERYVAYQDSFAKSGFITFKPDLRGHGKSEGSPVTSNFSDGYVIDALNLVSALEKDTLVDKNRIGMWGHSMGGGITLRSMVVSKNIKAGVIWAGVVGDYEDLLQRYKNRADWLRAQSNSNLAKDFYEKYGSPSANPSFWNEIDPYAFLKDISGPIQLHHGTMDESVPIEFSRHLKVALEMIGKPVELFEYPGADHNIAQGFSQAMQRSIEFFKKNL